MIPRRHSPYVLPLLALVAAPLAPAAEPVGVVGSATFFPLAEQVARRASASPEGGDYRIEARGTVAGIQTFCAGDGPGYPDILNASRRMRDAEVDACTAHGVTAIVEVKVGYDGVTLLSAGPERLNLGVRDLYLALARQVPDPGGTDQLVANPYRTWREVNPALPDTPIRVLASAAASGTRDSLAELALEAGCAQVDGARRTIGRSRHRMAELCRPLREDGPWHELPGGAGELTGALRADPEAVGVTGWHAVADSRTGLKTLAVEGTPPSPLAIATGSYPLSRPLFVYFKKSRLESLPAIQGYVNEVTSDAAWGQGGYLTNAGLVPMMLDERQQYSYIAGHSVEPICPPFCH
jgi:phosphate transport system substrate-binding protein